MQDRRLEKIQKEIEEIKRELQDIGEMRPGCLSKQIYYRNDKKYPYYQISYTYRMKSHTEYVSDGVCILSERADKKLQEIQETNEQMGRPCYKTRKT